jgi:hypothetical protein
VVGQLVNNIDLERIILDIHQVNQEFAHEKEMPPFEPR